MQLDKATWSWAKVIKNYDDVPNMFKEYLQPFSNNEETFPFTIFAPSNTSSSKKITANIISISPNKILFVEKVKKSMILKEYDFNNINYIEWGSIFLKSWITVSGISSEGGTISSTVEFNTVVEWIFMHVIKVLRSKVNTLEKHGDLRLEFDKIKYLRGKNYKFVSFAIKSLMQGEKIDIVILQPKVQVNRTGFWGSIFTRTIIDGHMCVLTNKELILIKDYGADTKYGGIINYVFLDRIENAETQLNQDDSTITLSLKLFGGDCISANFGIDYKSEVEMLSERISK